MPSVASSLGYSARNPSDHRELMERLAAYPSAPTTDADHRRALETQAALAASAD
ncbi:MAG: hypothetical protein M3063_17375 [Actinomycetota bacterium]|nr:hypothetical protein [Actinomycetota bacterium]